MTPLPLFPIYNPLPFSLYPLQVTQLGCRTLIFLLRQDISLFIEESFLMARQRGAKKRDSGLKPGAGGGAQRPPAKECSKSSLNGRDDGQGWVLPFSYRLNVEFKYAAEAALRCGCVV